MVKPLQDIIFRPIDGLWQSADGVVLADFLSSYDIVMDDRTQFARLYDYGRMLCFHYRASAGKVQITVNRIFKI